MAERDGEVVGGALAIVREGVWGLSLLVVRPDAQSSGAGRELLARAFAYGDGARGHIVLASRDPRALRAYARLGLALHPAVMARGRAQIAAVPEVRPGTADDLPLTEAVDRFVRGAAHGEDILALVEAGSRLLVLPERGYAMVRGAEVRLLAAFDEESAATLLRGCLAAADGADVGRRVHHERASSGRSGRVSRPGWSCGPRAGRCSWAGTSARSRPISPAVPTSERGLRARVSAPANCGWVGRRGTRRRWSAESVWAPWCREMVAMRPKDDTSPPRRPIPPPSMPKLQTAPTAARPVS